MKPYSNRWSGKEETIFYPEYAKTATIALVPSGQSSILYFSYVFVRTIGVCGVCKKRNSQLQ